MAFDYWARQTAYKEEKKRKQEQKLADAESRALAQRVKQLGDMKKLAMNGRPDPGNISVAGGSLISAGQAFANLQAYDRNKAIINDPEAVLQFLKTGNATAAAPFGNPLKNEKMNNKSADYGEEAQSLDAEQLEQDNPELLYQRRRDQALAAAKMRSEGRQFAFKPTLKDKMDNFFIY